MVASNSDGLRETIEQEYLHYGIEGARRMTFRVGVPLLILYIIADYFFTPVHFKTYFVARLAAAGIVIFGDRYFRRLKTLKSFVRLYSVQVFGYGILINLFVYNLNLPPNLFYCGLTFVASAGLGFFPFSKRFVSLHLVTIFTPSLIFAWRFSSSADFIVNYVGYIIFVIGTTFVIFMFRGFHERLLASEVVTRLNLQREYEASSQELRETRFELEKQEQSKATDKFISKVARQAAHDIRSPLSALSVVTKSLQSLSEEHRALAQAAIERITKTAEELLVSAKRGGVVAEIREFVVNGALNALVQEKNSVSSRAGRALVEFDEVGMAHTVFADRAHFLRMMSNLLQNAIEASPVDRPVKLHIATSADSSTEIVIEDRGCGISKENLANVGKEGFTFGKEGGHGLGLHHAVQSVRSWGGKFEIASTVGVGTNIKIVLPSRKLG